MVKFSASYEDSDTKKNKKRSKKFKEREDNGKKLRKKNPHFIALSMVKIMVTTPESAKSSRQGLKIKTSLNMEKMVTKRNSRNLISCRQKLPTKNPSMKS